MPESLSAAELFTQVLENRLRDLHVAMPGRVTKYELNRQTVDVQPVLQRAVPRGDDDPPLMEDLPVIQRVPLVFPRGGGFFLSVPVQVGDFVLCIFSERDIGAWRASGGSKVNPGDQRLHPLSGAMAIPGVFPAGDALSSPSGTNLTFGKDGGLVVTATPTRLEVGGASDAAALASAVTALRTALLAHTHPTAPTGPVSTPTFPSPPPSAGSIPSNVLKVSG